MTDTDTIVGTVVPLIGLGIVAGMANRMINGDRRPAYRPARPIMRPAPAKKYHKEHTHWY